MEIEDVDADFVANCFADAGATLAAMRATGHSLGMRISQLEVFDPADAILYAHNAIASRPAVPKSARIDAMDAIFAWLALIPNKTIRRIVAARCIVDSAGRPTSWRRIGQKFGISHHSVKAWHAKGIATIVTELNR